MRLSNFEIIETRIIDTVLYGYSFTILRKNSKQMKEKMLDRLKFSDELKEKLVMLVGYQNRLPKKLSRQYGLPNAHMLVNWVNIYKRSHEKVQDFTKMLDYNKY